MLFHVGLERSASFLVDSVEVAVVHFGLFDMRKAGSPEGSSDLHPAKGGIVQRGEKIGKEKCIVLKRLI